MWISYVYIVDKYFSSMLLKYSTFKYNKVCTIALKNVYNLYVKNL